MTLAFIGLGSNLGDGRSNLLTAWKLLGRQSGVLPLALSSPYLTRPVAKPEWRSSGRELGAQFFTNAVGVLESRLPPFELLVVLQEIENYMGRDRGRTLDRSIDLDLLYYDDLVLNEPGLIVPHSELEKRLFVLAPLADLAPDRLHPRLGLTTTQMRQRLPAGEESLVRRLDWDAD